mmetsp:Transcript_33374/g.109961  ORF Transcript_33374/g.109961 Transcript_33374/m.109961 type:complete len:393 (+) Transcript_33374:550-1728(+)
MAVAARVDEALVVDAPVVRDRVHALAVCAEPARLLRRGAAAGAARAGRRDAERPARVARQRHGRRGEGGRHVVLPRARLGHVVDALEVEVGRAAARRRSGGLDRGVRARRGQVLFEPEAVLVVVTEELRPDWLVRVEHDAAVATAAQPPRVRHRAAGRVALLEQVAEGVVRPGRVVPRRGALLDKVRAARASVVAEVAPAALVADAGRRPGRVGQGERGVVMRLVVSKGVRVADRRDQVERRVCGEREGVVVVRPPLERPRHLHRANAARDRVGEDGDGGGEARARAVLRLLAARAQLLLKDLLPRHHDRVRLVGHHHRVEPRAEPAARRAGESERGGVRGGVEGDAERDPDEGGHLPHAPRARLARDRRVRRVEGGGRGAARVSRDRAAAR